MGKADKWTRLGWQGIAFDTPADWCPGRLQGDFATGYLRIEDETHVRLELRWETFKRRGQPAEQFVDNYLRQALKKLGRREPKPRIDRGLYLPKLDGLDHEAFTWRGGFNAHSLVAVCGETRRVIHLRIFFEDAAEPKSVARRIFSTLTSGPQEGLLEWNVFDFGFRLPPAWRLETSSLRTGRLRLDFRDGRDELELTRFSLAEMLLRKRTLRAWFAAMYAKLGRRFRVALDECAYRDHAAIRCHGVSRGRTRPLDLLRRKRHLTALAWRCEALDKIFAIRLVGDRPEDPRVERYAERVRCP